MHKIAVFMGEKKGGEPAESESYVNKPRLFSSDRLILKLYR